MAKDQILSILRKISILENSTEVKKSSVDLVGPATDCCKLGFNDITGALFYRNDADIWMPIVFNPGTANTNYELKLTTNNTSGAASYNPLTDTLNIPMYGNSSLYELNITTVGTSGPATYSSATDTLNIPIYGNTGGTSTPLTLTTTGTSGTALYYPLTNTLNIPNIPVYTPYELKLTTLGTGASTYDAATDTLNIPLASSSTPYELNLTTTGVGAASYTAATDTLNIPTPAASIPYELNLTTLGTTGVATYNAASDTLNIPNYAGGAATLSRFGIEDNVGIQNRVMDMGSFNLKLINPSGSGYFTHITGDQTFTNSYSRLFSNAAFSSIENYDSINNISTSIVCNLSSGGQTTLQAGSGLGFSSVGISALDGITLNNSNGKYNILNVPNINSGYILNYNPVNGLITYNIATSGGGGGATVTADNGLTKTVDNIQLGGTLINNTLINANDKTFTFTGTLNTLTVQNTGINGAAIYAVGGNGSAAVQAFADAYAPIQSYRKDNTNNSVVYGLIVQTDAAATGADGIGTAILMNSQTNGGSYAGNELISKLTTATAGAIRSEFSITGIHDATKSTILALKSTGQLQLPNYTSSGSFPGTAVGNLGFDASGNIITTAATGGGGGGIYELALTTAGTSGPATYNAATDTLNIPNYASGGGGTPFWFEVTKLELDNLITTNTLTKGGTYRIANVDPTLYGGTDVVLQAVSTNKLSLEGAGLFYNPKYNQAVADYGIWHNTSSYVVSNIVGTFPLNAVITNDLGGTATVFGNITGNRFTIIGGTWVGAISISSGANTATIASVSVTSYASGSTIIWGGKHWTNISGNPGTATDIKNLSAADWTVTSYDSTVYNAVWDTIDYDYENNFIVRRADINGNIVSNSKSEISTWSGMSRVISIFQWGNPYVESTVKGCGHNHVIGGYCDNLNYIACVAHNRIESRGYIYLNRTYGATFIGNQMSGGGNIAINTVVNGGINNNSLNRGNNNNSTVPSTIESNTVTSSFINSNTLTITSKINSNTLTSVSYIYDNVLSINSNINSNTLTNSYIYKNIIDQTSGINSNTFNIGPGFIFDNRLRNTSLISSNVFTGAQNLIFGNDLMSLSQINSNALTNRGIIVRNKLWNLSRINSNTATGNTGQGGEAFISGNDCSTGEISANSVIVTSGRKLIACCRLFGDVNQDTPIRSSKITGCTVSGSGYWYIRGMELINSELQAITANDVEYRNFKLNNTVLNFSNITYSSNVENLTIDPRNMEVSFSKGFTGGASFGAIGAVSLPPFPIPTGYFIDKVLVDVGTGLTGAGAILNFGFTTDAPQGALNDTTGDIATLNTNGISIIQPSAFAKATAARILTMEVKTANITAGTITITLKFSKLT